MYISTIRLHNNSKFVLVLFHLSLFKLLYIEKNLWRELLYKEHLIIMWYSFSISLNLELFYFSAWIFIFWVSKNYVHVDEGTNLD